MLDIKFIIENQKLVEEGIAKKVCPSTSPP